jgi:putative DNA primase/helicase
LKVSSPDNGPAHDPDQKVLDPYGNLVTRREFHRKWQTTDERDLKGWPKVGGRCPVCGGRYCKVSPAQTYIACEKTRGEIPVFDVSGKEVLYGLLPLDNEPALVLDGKPLMPKHLKELEASGLTEETIREAGIYSEARRGYVKALLGWSSYPGTLGQVLVFPYHFPDEKTHADLQLVDEDGRLITPVIRSATYHRLKPDHPRDRGDGDGSIKYEATKGQPSRAYFTPGTLPVLQDAAVALIITEGEKKALKADQEGFRCIGLAGVDCWSRKRDRDEAGLPIGARRLLDDLAALPWKGRLVYICFDSDRETNPDVQRAERHLTRALASLGAVVKIVKIPDDGEEKTGIDDFLVAHGPDAFRRLLEEAKDPGILYANETEPVKAITNSLRQARLFLEKNCQHPDGPTLRYGNGGCYYQWDDTTYKEATEKDLTPLVVRSIREEFQAYDVGRLLRWEKELHAHDDAPEDAPRPGKKPVALDVTKGLVGNVVQAIQSEVFLGARVSPHTWIGGEHSPYILVARNGLVDLERLLAGKPDFLTPHTPRFFSTRRPLDFDVEVEDPAEPVEWLKFLSQLWPDDAQSIRCLQEWFGYCLTQDTRQQKALLLVGPPRAGKGTIARVLLHLLGEGNVAFTSFATLGGPFGLEDLVDKSLAVIGDAEASHMRAEEKTNAVQRLKSITGEDPVPVNRKGLAIVTRKLPLRFMIMTNDLPDLEDASGALASRFLTLQLEESFLGKEDLGLEERLLAELPGIFRWACEGWRSLQKNGRFDQPKSGAELGVDLKHQTSPLLQFVGDCCLVGPEHWTETDRLFAAWQEFSLRRPDPAGRALRQHRRARAGRQAGRGRAGGGDRPASDEGPDRPGAGGAGLRLLLACHARGGRPALLRLVHPAGPARRPPDPPRPHGGGVLRRALAPAALPGLPDRPLGGGRGVPAAEDASGLGLSRRPGGLHAGQDGIRRPGDGAGQAVLRPGRTRRYGRPPTRLTADRATATGPPGPADGLGVRRRCDSRDEHSSGDGG